MSRKRLRAWLLRRWYDGGPVWFFIPLTALFIGLTAIRRWCYRRGIFTAVTLPAPVIVVGNITVGGTGKTPFVVWLAQVLQAQGYQPGIIARGYAGKSEHWPLLVTSATDPMLAGDEAVLLARRTHLPVMVGPDRVNAARCMLEKFPVNVIISDDGLQHYRMARLIDIIMLDGKRGFGNLWRLPAGPLRESTGRLNEADFVVCKTDSAAMASMPAGTAVMRLSLGSAIRLGDGRSVPLAEFSGRQVHAVAGIGHPQQFFEALGKYGLRVDGRALPDHAELSEADLTFDDEAPVLMTEKDAIKCCGLRLPRHWYVPASVEFTEEDAARILKSMLQQLMSQGVTPVNKH